MGSACSRAFCLVAAHCETALKRGWQTARALPAGGKLHQAESGPPACGKASHPRVPTHSHLRPHAPPPPPTHTCTCATQGQPTWIISMLMCPVHSGSPQGRPCLFVPPPLLPFTHNTLLTHLDHLLADVAPLVAPALRGVPIHSVLNPHSVGVLLRRRSRGSRQQGGGESVERRGEEERREGRHVRVSVGGQSSWCKGWGC